LLNVVEELELPAPPSELGGEDQVIFPAQLLRLVVLTVRSDFEVAEQGWVRIWATLPDGREATPNEFPVDLSEASWHRSIITIPGPPVVAEGVYRFLVDCRSKDDDWGEPFDIPFLLTFA
jgi:hypothetical protein